MRTPRLQRSGAFAILAKIALLAPGDLPNPMSHEAGLVVQFGVAPSTA